MKYYELLIIGSLLFSTFSCQRASVGAYRMETVDSIHISFYKECLQTYVCIDNKEGIDSICNMIYNLTTKCTTKFYPIMEVTLYGSNQKQVFGISKEYLKGPFCGKSEYDLEEIIKGIYNKSIR